MKEIEVEGVREFYKHSKQKQKKTIFDISLKCNNSVTR